MEKFIRNILAARFDITDMNRQGTEFIDLFDSVEKKTAFAKRMKKLNGPVAMATLVAAIAKGKDIALVPEGQRQLPSPQRNAKVTPMRSNYTNWNNYEVLSNFVNDDDGKQI